jgi:hypothetical protein
VISDQNNPINHPIYVVYEDLVCCFIFSLNEEYSEAHVFVYSLLRPTIEVDGVRKMYFGGA